ncbi:hypothetical protein AVEN_115385-1 [Araneus ventricosus]|uniref:Uncharacterized protein n=1 Tax=Araneus ventricosus TaxID=182803 RepID=A0A4Y1ZYB5_ARAVE|nr:hypothetical protein AVEN_115385-1 [Araneus ventricosus]
MVPDTINLTLLKDSYRGDGISLGGHTDLYVLCEVHALPGMRYRNEILDPYDRPYVGSTGDEFFLMDDNPRFHRTMLVEEYLEDQGVGVNGLANSISGILSDSESFKLPRKTDNYNTPLPLPQISA